MSKKGKQVLGFMILCIRLVFIFMDAASFSKSQNLDTSENKKISYQQDISHDSAEIGIKDNMTYQFIENETKDLVEKQVESPKVSDKNTEIKKQFESLEIEKFSLDTLSSKISNRLNTLDSLYQKTKDENVLKIIIDELLGDYQFNTVKSYLSQIDIFKSSVIDKQSYIYTYINTLSITDPNSMSTFISFIDQLKSQNLVGNDDYLFYKGMQSLWDKKYDEAINIMKPISNPIYTGFIDELQETINNFKNQKGLPEYYEDALISLSALKNGYFAIANKLSIEAVLEDEDYILPYQILAYSNFLTKNRDKSISYFYNLTSLDIEKKDKYNFYLGISYYWKGDYENSVTTLYQLINNTTYKVDVYRYLLLNYEQLGQSEKMVQIWQKLLGEYALTESDFKYFYDIAFYKPYSQGKRSDIYENYKQISNDIVSMCYDKFGYKNDTCLYGEVGLNITNGLRIEVEDNLLYLAENYPQASIYQALGDYYKNNNQIEKAKSYYIEAISFSDSSIQKGLMESSLLKLMN